MVAQIAEATAQHPVLAALRDLHALLDRVHPAMWAGLSPDEVRTAAQQVARAKNRLDAHALAAARALQGTDVARREGAVSNGDLLGRDLGNDRNAGNRIVSAARQVRAQSPTEKALVEGELTLHQAQIIATGLKNLPTDTTPEQRDLAERTLLRDARVYSPKDLRSRADRIPDQWAPRPDVDVHESALLEQRERQAWDNTRLSMWSNGDGTTSGRFTVPDAHAAMLKTVLDGYASPRRASMIRGETSDEYGRRLGQGFCELIERVPTDGLPNHGGNNVTVSVNIDLADLTEQLDRAASGTMTVDGTRLSPGQVRRLACDAKILPQVFAGESVPLDLGRERRLFSRHQRNAIANRDGGCSFPGCDRPPGWCEAHHANETWAAGGTTDLKDAALLCAEHHRQVHHEHWQYRLNPRDGIPEYKKTTGVRWLRNRRWRP